jgi:hypothetical protein
MVFCSPEWEQQFENPILQPLSSSISNHCPLLLTPLSQPSVHPIFRFESYWTQMPGFLDCVKEAWSRQVLDSHNHLATLHTKLSRTAKALKVWSRTLTSQAMLASVIYREVIERLELAQEIRQLSEGEKSLVKKLKSRLLGLAAIEKCRAR